MILEQYRAQAGVAGFLDRLDMIEVARHHRWAAMAMTIDRPFQQPFDRGCAALPCRLRLMRPGRLFCADNVINIRSETRSGGKECVSTCRYGWSRDPLKKKQNRS